jgi:hypothetical protein
VTVHFQNLPEHWQAGKSLPVTVVVRDEDGAPAIGRRVSVSRFVHTGWNELEKSMRTDKQGRVIVEVPTHHESGIISIAASVEGVQPERNDTGWKQESRKRYGAYRHVVLTE